jgi:cellulose synthase/poly-beta-1,6-N-acetylglucosamine synthase-like glycosyltransferase
MLENGARIVYAAEARSRTEAPATIRTLSKQRFRWSFGTFQCLWKHRHAFFKGPLGWVALPNMFLFQVLFPALSPIGDVVFILSILRGDMEAIAVGYLLFLFMDVCGSLLAFILENKRKRLMFLVLIQRFFYRQFMYIITFKAMFAMLKGARYGWNKLERQGTVRMNPELAKSH